MSYQINKTNGNLLVNLVDGQIDRNSTNLVLVGKNYTGFGEFINENFVKLLENFSNTAAPSNPLEGQVWWDATEKKLKVYNGLAWKSLGIPYANSAQINKFAGDIWFDSLTKQLFAYDGTKIILIGPNYSEIQGKSGLEAVTVADSQGPNTLLKWYIGAALVAVVSNKTFTPLAQQRIPELVSTANPTGVIYKGINVVSNTFDFVGTANSSRGIIDTNGVFRTAADFVSSKVNSSMNGTLTIRNTGGLRIGPQSNTILSINQNRFDITNQVVNQDFAIKVKNNQSTVDAIYVNSTTNRVGIFNSDPVYTLDVAGSQQVTGDLVVGGDLLVNGETIQISVTTLDVEGKTVELFVSGGLPFGDDAEASGGGIVLRSTNSDKTLLWDISNTAWTSNQNINLSSVGSSYKINGVDKLIGNSLVNVTSAPDLTSIGTLNSLNVDYISIDTRNIVSTSNELVLTAPTYLTLNAGVSVDVTNNKRITGVGDPIYEQDVANKRYVDRLTEFFTLDVTGLGTGTALINAVSGILTTLIPPTSENENKVVRLLTSSYAATVSGIVVDVEASKVIDNVFVDSNGTQNVRVVENVTFNPATASSGTLALSVNRAYMVYKRVGLTWEHQSTTPF